MYLLAELIDQIPPALNQLTQVGKVCGQKPSAGEVCLQFLTPQALLWCARAGCKAEKSELLSRHGSLVSTMVTMKGFSKPLSGLFTMPDDPASIRALADLSAQSSLAEVLRKRDWIFDPPPPWLNLNKDQLARFARMQIDFKLKELQIQQEKLQALGKIL